MQITDIRIRKVKKADRLKAVASVTIDDAFVVHDIKVIQGQDRLFIAMPSRKSRDGGFMDVAHPINTSTREMLHGAILDKYQEFADTLGEEADTPSDAEATEDMEFEAISDPAAEPTDSLGSAAPQQSAEYNSQERPAAETKHSSFDEWLEKMKSGLL